MFLEIVEPRVLDLISTRDRCKVRVCEKKVQDGRYWVSFSFLSADEATKFFKDCIDLVEKGGPAE